MSNHPPQAQLPVSLSPTPIVDTPVKKCQGRCPGCQKRQSEAQSAADSSDRIDGVKSPVQREAF